MRSQQLLPGDQRSATFSAFLVGRLRPCINCDEVILFDTAVAKSDKRANVAASLEKLPTRSCSQLNGQQQRRVRLTRRDQARFSILASVPNELNSIVHTVHLAFSFDVCHVMNASHCHTTPPQTKRSDRRNLLSGPVCPPTAKCAIDSTSCTLLSVRIPT